MSTLFSIFVTVISLGTILGCFLLLMWCRKDKMGVEEGKSMGHSFDGIEEINNRCRSGGLTCSSSSSSPVWFI